MLITITRRSSHLKFPVIIPTYSKTDDSSLRIPLRVSIGRGIIGLLCTIVG